MSGTKVRSLDDAAAFAGLCRKLGKKVVFTNGCFDLIHFGHVQYLEKAKSLGDCLIIGLNTDRSVQKLKGPKRPLVAQQDRARVLAAFSCVDCVTFFGEETPLEIIAAIRPDVLVKGADWKKDQIVGAPFVRSYGGKIATIAFAKGRSTTTLIKKIVHAYR